jgi:NAD(P)-dependent dehydrogenase (short-subunit alcohol dehydrogenase family)
MLAGALAIEGVRANMEGQTLLGRLAQPEEIGRVVRFLLSDDASYITAATLVADGGVVSSQR